jgi:hypothetical protein
MKKQKPRFSNATGRYWAMFTQRQTPRPHLTIICSSLIFFLQVTPLLRDSHHTLYAFIFHLRAVWPINLGHLYFTILTVAGDLCKSSGSLFRILNCSLTLWPLEQFDFEPRNIIPFCVACAQKKLLFAYISLLYSWLVRGLITRIIIIIIIIIIKSKVLVLQPSTRPWRRIGGVEA